MKNVTNKTPTIIAICFSVIVGLIVCYLSWISCRDIGCLFAVFSAPVGGLFCGVLTFSLFILGSQYTTRDHTKRRYFFSALISIVLGFLLFLILRLTAIEFFNSNILGRSTDYSSSFWNYLIFSSSKEIQLQIIVLVFILIILIIIPLILSRITWTNKTARMVSFILLALILPSIIAFTLLPKILIPNIHDDDSIRTLALNSKNSEYCKYINDQTKRYGCVLTIGEMTSNTNVCEIIRGEELYDSCILNVNSKIKAKQNSDLIKKQFAESTQDITDGNCDKIGIGLVKDKCVEGKALSNNNLDLCISIDGYETRDHCILTLALKNRNATMCKFTLIDGGSDICKNQVYSVTARETKDPSICDNIKDQNNKRSCYREVDLEISTSCFNFKECLECNIITDEKLRSYCTERASQG